MNLSATMAGFSVRDNEGSLIQTNPSFLLALRFLLGLAEAGLYPGTVFYISSQASLEMTSYSEIMR